MLSEEQADVWPVPNVEKAVDEGQKNALGLSKTWRYEPPESDEEEEVVPLTAEDIEAIRQAAYEEGFSQGKEEGFAKGYEEGKVAGHNEGLQAGKDEG